jgi:hypothetical protein
MASVNGFRGWLLGGLLLTLLVAAAPAAADDARYALANGCYSLTSGGRTLVSDVGPFRMKATDLGSYMLYGRKGDYLARTELGDVGTASDASDQADWTVDGAAGDFTITLKAANKALAPTPGGGLALVDPPQAGHFAFVAASGCAEFPESQLDVTGAPTTQPTSWGAVKGILDAHMHWMAFEFLGGKAHCGKPWDRYGIAHALVDCPDHAIPGSPGNVLEAALGGPPMHDVHGWPTFAYWPNYYSLTHENSYYRWIERAWRAGLRIMVNLYVDNAALCKVYPEKSHDCDEMDTVRLEMTRLHQMIDYIDAQNGGPGKGWLQIVTDPFQARKVISEGKLAIVQGIEVSELFDCTIYNLVPQCNAQQTDQRLQQVYDAGVRSMELVNKFDNAYVGVAGDDGNQGVIVNNGNKLETGRYWDMKTCQGLPMGEADKTQLTPAQNNAALGSFFTAFLPEGQVPAYPPPPHCNQLGLSTLGVHLLKDMMAKGMIVDPDHMSVAARDATLDLLEARRYGGVISSHSWSTPEAYPRILKLGGVVTPITQRADSFLTDWRTLRAERDPRYLFGFGYGADINGFHGSPRPAPDASSSPLAYPFKSLDGRQTLDRLTTGERTWDVNKDGVANYGLLPDWIAGMANTAGPQFTTDMENGAEAYLEMWERAEGVSAYRPQPARLRFRTPALGRVLLGASPEALLRSAGQPRVRGAWAWRWDVQRRERRGGRITVVFSPAGVTELVASTGPEHKAGGVGTDDPARAIRGAHRVGRGLLARGRVLYGVRGGRVRFVALAPRKVLASPSLLRRDLRRARLA